ncbi:MAG: tetratricopeptide repeat protein [Pseudonocardiaceae bacterium]
MSQPHLDGSFLGIAVGEYENTNHPALPRAVPQTQELADALTGFGYRPTVLENPTLAELRTRLDEWRHGRATLGHAPVLLTWSGHAKAVRDELRLAAHDSPAAFPSAGSYRPESLVEEAMDGGADQILVLIDTCQSGQGALAVVAVALHNWVKRTFPPGRACWVGVLASCQPDEDAAGSGALLDAAGRVLRQGPSANGYRRAWTVRNAGITGPELIQTLLGELAQDEQRPVNVESGTAQVMFHNPRWRPAQRPQLVEHLVLASRGIAPQEEGWFFTGRRAVLQRIVTWMGEANPGAFVVTGSAGCGKSAVVGRIAALSDPTERAALLEHAPLEPQDPDPGVGTVDAALHLRGRGVQDVATALAEALGLPAPENHWQLVAQVTQMQSPPTVVLDGLDEAITEQVNEIATDLLVPLCRVARVLLATRDRAFTLRQPAAPEPSFVWLRGLFGPAAPVVDLDADAGTTQDIERYVARRLRVAGRGDLEQRVAPVLSRRAAGDPGGFLYARIVTSQVVRQVVDVQPQGWEQQLAETISGALEHDLTAGVALVHDGRELPGAARDLLRALAWGLGRGMPGRGVWEAAATALSPEGVEYQATDLDWVLEHYGRYIVEDGTDGQAVYRLYHREFVEHLLGSSPPVAGRPAVQALAEALVTLTETQTDGAREPEQSSPYLRRHLGQHASLANAPGITALRRLAQANPDAYLPDLAGSLNNLAIRLAEVGQRQAALAPAQQAVDIRRELAQANPDAYLPDLAMSLNNLANRLAEVGRIAETQEVFTGCIGAFAASPVARDVLLVERARFQLRHGEAPAGLRDLTVLLTSSGTEAMSTVLVSARRALRAHRTVDGPAVDRVWRETTGTEPPGWLALTDEQLRLVADWIGTPTWTESKNFLAAHADELLASPADLALDELVLLDPPLADQHRQVLARTREHGIDAAYQPLVLQDLLRAWISTESWPDSQSFAEQHAAELLAPEAETVLAGFGDEPVIAVHLAMLGLARRDGMAATYACVTDRQLAAGRMRRALIDVDPYAIAQVATLEGHVFGEWFTAAAHLAVTYAIGEATAVDDTELSTRVNELDTLVKQADVADRQRVAAEVAELIGRSPEHAGRLSALLGMLLQPTPT